MMKKHWELAFKSAWDLRKLILNNKSNFNKETDLLLYLASRSENISLLKKKRMVLLS